MQTSAAILPLTSATTPAFPPADDIVTDAAVPALLVKLKDLEQRVEDKNRIGDACDLRFAHVALRCLSLPRPDLTPEALRAKWIRSAGWIDETCASLTRMLLDPKRRGADDDAQCVRDAVAKIRSLMQQRITITA